MWFVVSNLLDAQRLGMASDLIRLANFVEGRAGGSCNKRLKNNLEMTVSDPYLRLVQLLDQSLDSSAELNDRLLPRYRTTPVINRYDTGMKFAGNRVVPDAWRTRCGRVILCTSGP